MTALSEFWITLNNGKSMVMFFYLVIFRENHSKNYSMFVS